MVRVSSRVSSTGFCDNYPPTEAGQVHIVMGMSKAIATANLFRYEPTEQGGISFSRIRQRLLPSSCVERIDLVIDAVAGSLTDMDVRPIVCAGLF